MRGEDGEGFSGSKSCKGRCVKNDFYTPLSLDETQILPRFDGKASGKNGNAAQKS